MSKKSFCLLLILVLALFFRLYRISESPPSLNWDEVSHGYNAYSILKTGKDEWGTSWPLIFRAYGDYKLPLYIYLTVPAVATFGLNAFSVRLVSVLAGVGLVLLAYLITKRLSKNETTALLSALLTAISPWSLFVSRIAVEANLGAFLFALGGYFWLQWRESHRTGAILGLAIAWGLCLFAYNSARVLVPLGLLFTLANLGKNKHWPNFFQLALLSFIFFLPIIGQFLDRSGRARFELVSLIDQGAVNQIISQRQSSRLPPLMARLVFNRPNYFVFQAAKNYLANFSPVYLFFRGGSHYQFSQPNHELLFLVTAPFLLWGILRTVKRRNERLLSVWFFVSFIPSAITRDAPHVLRSIFVLPIVMILTALGIESVVQLIGPRSRFKGNLLLWVLILAFFVNFGKWWKDYQEIYPKAYSWAWQYGYREAVAYVKANYGNYDQIYFTKRLGEPHEFIAFYWPWSPLDFQQKKVWDYHANWYWVNGLDKFKFENDWEVIESVKCEMGSEKCLLVTSPGNYPEGWKMLKKINYLNGQPALEILENGQ